MVGRSLNKLTAVQIRKAPAGKLSDGGGLILKKGEDTGKWVYRYSINGKRRDMGLGPFPEISLAEARIQRSKWAALIPQGVDPIVERERLATEAQNRSDPTYAEMTQIVFEGKKAGLRGDGKRGRWLSPLLKHMMPKLGHKRMSTIHQTDIKDALAPIWKNKHPTAEKAIQRTHIIFTQAKLMGVDCDPFTVDAAKHMLGEVHHQTVSVASTAWQDVPDLYEALGRSGASYACLRLIILTCVRGSSARGLHLDEIDGDVWTVPADRMKGTQRTAKDFRVPLSAAALQLIEEQTPFARNGELFPSYRAGHISDSAIGKVMRELNAGTPHGLRTSFRTWVQDTESASYEVAETVLSHTIGGKTERSYARSDLLESRRIVMEKWAGYVTRQSADVVRLYK